VVQRASAQRPGNRRTTRRFKLGDRVSWNSEAGRVSGKIVKVHTTDVNYKGYVHHASKDGPQYKIKATRPITLPCTRQAR
jgi:Hypervirulence associated proteins TUDOR domain